MNSVARRTACLSPRLPFFSVTRAVPSYAEAIVAIVECRSRPGMRIVIRQAVFGVHEAVLMLSNRNLHCVMPRHLLDVMCRSARAAQRCHEVSVEQ